MKIFWLLEHFGIPANYGGPICIDDAFYTSKLNTPYLRRVSLRIQSDINFLLYQIQN